MGSRTTALDAVENEGSQSVRVSLIVILHVGASTRENQSRSGVVVVEILLGIEGGGGGGKGGCMILGQRGMVRERKGGKLHVPRQNEVGRY